MNTPSLGGNNLPHQQLPKPAMGGTGRSAAKPRGDHRATSRISSSVTSRHHAIPSSKARRGLANFTGREILALELCVDSNLTHPAAAVVILDSGHIKRALFTSILAGAPITCSDGSRSIDYRRGANFLNQSQFFMSANALPKRRNNSQAGRRVRDQSGGFPTRASRDAA